VQYKPTATVRRNKLRGLKSNKVIDGFLSCNSDKDVDMMESLKEECKVMQPEVEKNPLLLSQRAS
jgi:hypothetical protein